MCVTEKVRSSYFREEETSILSSLEGFGCSICLSLQIANPQRYIKANSYCSTVPVVL